MDSAKPISVVKVGGSLLCLPDLGKRLKELLSILEPKQRVVLVIGGGAAADLVREWDRVHVLGDEAAHQLAVAAMSLNAALLAHVLPATAIVGSVAEAELAWDRGDVPVVDAQRWLQRHDPDSTIPLPHDWSVTSDSIAAWIGLQLQAARLQLVKSIDVPAVALEQAAAAGDVDAAFPGFAARLPRIDWVNLREEPLSLRQWRPESGSGM